jgi:hypothetical protein
MSSEIKILRLSTGEDVIAKVGENDQGVSLKYRSYNDNGIFYERTGKDSCSS